MKTGVQIRLMGEDAAAVEAATLRLQEAFGDAFVVTGRAPTRRGPGMRIYGALAAPTTPSREGKR